MAGASYHLGFILGMGDAQKKHIVKLESKQVSKHADKQTSKHARQADHSTFDQTFFHLSNY